MDTLWSIGCDTVYKDRCDICYDGDNCNVKEVGGGGSATRASSIVVGSLLGLIMFKVSLL